MKIDLGKNELIHFVGIGGIGMSGLALIMNGLGYKVQGSDIACLLYTSPSPRDGLLSRMPSSA